MSRIERIRRTTLLGRAIKADNDPQDEVAEARPPALPMVVGPQPRPDSGERDGAAVFTAQLMGQDGQKRGLRAGPLHIDQARGAYNKVEWSGSRDRRARAGRNAKTEV
ncbi:hypothetical protein [Phenylobacterium zucineum]|nr:hypothetical protein [Phenylobacterium zucineum]